MHPNDQFFVIRSRIADAHAQAGAERAARAARRELTGLTPQGRLSAGRSWLGRRLVAAGTAISGGAPGGPDREPSGRPC